MPDLMFRITRNGSYLSYNAPNTRDLYDEHVVGLTVWDRLPRDLADRIIEAGRTAIDQGIPQVIEYQLDFDGEIGEGTTLQSDFALPVRIGDERMSGKVNGGGAALSVESYKGSIRLVRK